MLCHCSAVLSAIPRQSETQTGEILRHAGTTVRAVNPRVGDWRELVGLFPPGAVWPLSSSWEQLKKTPFCNERKASSVRKDARKGVKGMT